jgi:TetR/AcrR family transcriptional regulator, regulator of autoinduction and epiphytic fitness
MSDVKRNSSPGRQRARATRNRIIDHAYRLFCEHGWTQTTMEAVGKSAGVAVQTVYYVFRTKAQLLREVIEFAAAGEHDPPPVPARPWMQEALAAGDGARTLAVTVEHGVDIYHRVAPLNRTIHTAAESDAELDAYWQAIAGRRRDGMRQLIAHLADLGQLRGGLTEQRATEILYVLNSHETMLGLIRDSDWTLTEYKAWIFELLCGQLLAEPPGTEATAGLTFTAPV